MNRLTCFCIPVPLPLQNPLSLRGQFSNWPWQSVPPVPSAPLPKGGCHGAAVTGGFLPRTALLVTLRRGGVLPRPREGQSPSPTHRKIRFRRAGCPQPAARQPPHHHGGVRARRPTQVFRHFRRGDPCGRPPGLYRISYNVSLRGRTAPTAKRGVGDAAPYEVLSVNGV